MLNKIYHNLVCGEITPSEALYQLHLELTSLDVRANNYKVHKSFVYNMMSQVRMYAYLIGRPICDDVYDVFDILDRHGIDYAVHGDTLWARDMSTVYRADGSWYDSEAWTVVTRKNVFEWLGY